MRVLFLDFDGVLITKPKGREPSPECVAQLNRITEETGAALVVSSTWRHLHSLNELRALLQKWGVTGEVIGMTPSVHKADVTRGDEIAAWLKSHQDVRSFGIVDDDPDVAPFRDQHVKTEFSTGLTPEVANAVIAKLARMTIER